VNFDSALFPVFFKFVIILISGYESMAMCVNGVCAANAVMGVTNACKYLCGKDSCLDAVDAGTCDLNKVLNENYSGAKWVCINGMKKFHLFFTLLLNFAIDS